MPHINIHAGLMAQHLVWAFFYFHVLVYAVCWCDLYQYLAYTHWKDRSSCIGGSRMHEVYRQARVVCQNNVLSGIKSRGRPTSLACQ